MTEEIRKPHKPVTFERAVEFLKTISEGRTCNVCASGTSWTVTAQVNHGEPAQYPALITADSEGGAYIGSTGKYILVTCKNCGNTHLHDLNVVMEKLEVMGK